MSTPTLRSLKSRAQLLKPVLRLGKAGATPEFIQALDTELALHGLVKIRFEGFKEERKAIVPVLSEKTGATLVQQVGHTAVFFRVQPGAPASPASLPD